MDELELAVAMIKDTYLEALYRHVEECGEVAKLVHVARETIERIATTAERARTIANEARGLSFVAARLEGAPGSHVFESAPGLTDLEGTQSSVDEEGARAQRYLQR